MMSPVLCSESVIKSIDKSRAPTFLRNRTDVLCFIGLSVIVSDVIIIIPELATMMDCGP